MNLILCKVMPPPNRYEEVCTDPVSACTGAATEVRFTVDTAGNLLVPVDWSPMGELDLSMTYRHFDTWTARYEPFEEEFPMTFVTNADGDVAEVVSPWEPLVAPIRFARRVDEPKT